MQQLEVKSEQFAFTKHYLTVHFGWPFWRAKNGDDWRAHSSCGKSTPTAWGLEVEDLQRGVF